MTRIEEMVECSKLKGIRAEHLRKLYLAGWTDEQVADFFSVNRSTIHRWFKMNPEMNELRRDWKEAADEKVERALLANALGYTCPEEKIFVHYIDNVDAFGQVTGKRRKITRVKTLKHFPPNTQAQQFWLTNRKRQDWRRTREEEAQDPLSVKVFNIVQANKNGKSGGNGHPGGNGKAAGGNGRDLPSIQTTVSVQRNGMRIID